MPFTSVLTSQPVAFLGMTDGFGALCDSVVNAEASAEIGFGLFVKDHGTPIVAGDNTTRVIKLTANTDKVSGCIKHTHAVQYGGELGDVGYKPGAVMNRVRRGRVWVPCQAAAVSTDKVYIVVANGTVGGVRPTADSTNTIDASSWCQFVRYDATLGAALVEFDVTSRNATPL